MMGKYGVCEVKKRDSFFERAEKRKKKSDSIDDKFYIDNTNSSP